MRRTFLCGSLTIVGVALVAAVSLGVEHGPQSATTSRSCGPAASTLAPTTAAGNATTARGTNGDGCLDRPATATLTIDNVALSFDRQVYTVPAGRVRVRWVGDSGLIVGFGDPRFRRCQLSTGNGGRPSCQVTLTPGRYLFYDLVPSHRAAGLQTTIIATPTK